MSDLLLTMSNPTTLNQIIPQVVQCDNNFFERHQEKHWE
jgi:hypothetical protein